MQQTIRIYEYDNNLIEKINRSADTILVECFGTNAFSVTLPDLMGSQGKDFTFKNYGAGAVTLGSSNYQMIDVADTFSVTVAANGFLQMMSDGIDRWVILI